MHTRIGANMASLTYPSPISTPAVVSHRLHSQVEEELGSYTGTGLRPSGLQSSAELASSGRHHTRKKKQEKVWSFSCSCIHALLTLQLSKSVTFHCFENHIT